ncbi:MAG: ETC complex I subunit [Janthinobacterium lividum]
MTGGDASRNCSMMKARIHQRPKSSTQSGKARTGQWVLDYEPAEKKKLDPLTGWSGSGDMRGQVSLAFDDVDSAVAYAQAHGLDYEVHALAPNPLKLQSYADNFR